MVIMASTLINAINECRHVTADELIQDNIKTCNRYEIQVLFDGHIIHNKEFIGTYEQAENEGDMIIQYNPEFSGCEYRIIPLY